MGAMSVNQEANLPLLRRIADAGLSFALDVVDDSAATGRCYLDIENTDTGELFRLELVQEES